MDRNAQSKQQPQEVSPFAKDKTYGEKKYDLIFGKLINFWLNLTVSAGFTFLVKHAEGGPFKWLRGKQEKWIDDLSTNKFVRKEGDLAESHRQAESIINVLTLLTPGHFVMIPSVWLGEKYKANIVKYFDRKHYGDAAMDNTDMKARHDAIAVAEKPTFIGTIMGRAGAAMVNVGISRVIGSEENMINKLGKKYNNKSAQGFKGIDDTADNVGVIAGEAANKIMPGPVGWLNKKFSSGMTYSRKQVQDWDAGKVGAVDVTVQPYSKGFDNLTRYFVQDIMYTLSTALFVKPIVMGLRNILPGMTYKPKAKPDMDLARIEQIKLPSKPFMETEAATLDKAEPAQDTIADKPSSRVSHIHKEKTVTTQNEAALAQ